MKREDLRDFGLTDEQLQKIMDLHGADVERQKQAISTLTAERDAARTQLSEANQKLEGYDPDWRQKADQATREAERQVSDLKAQYAAGNAAAGLKFTSESARRAFLADLTAKKLPLQDDGKLLGFDDFVASYRQSDPGAFAPEGGLPRVSGSAPGRAADPTAKDQANAALRAAFGRN